MILDKKTGAPKISSDSPELGAQMTSRLIDWTGINSSSNNPGGLAKMHHAITQAFAGLPGMVETVELPPVREFLPNGDVVHQAVGNAYRHRCRPGAPVQVLLSGHMDTVYPPDHPFQHAKIDPVTGRLNAPGAADMKGGLLVMLHTLQAFEECGEGNVGWEVLITADEEIGSIASDPLFAEAAARCHVGLIFEPCMPDGSLARSRKGSGTFNAVVTGRAAHAGRAFSEGRNAIVALAELIGRIHELNREFPHAVFNTGRVQGGGALNVVPDRAAAQFNFRVPDPETIPLIEANIAAIVEDMSRREGFSINWQGGFTRPPKKIGPAEEAIFAQICTLAAADGETLQWKDTGGCCDGNNLSYYGLPNIDTLGPRGAHIHSSQEFVELASMPQRVRLATRLLLEWARHGLPAGVA
jgi:glutamate carboxypeptidase